ncbi:hypothetical protein SSP24_37110 [Streptomyces spinoverrucosus]|uniref:Uncharacterized protein n=1 Tax=Streptomyces spinoverrucosus TaxID=284043 RepID=A0A4Y3VLZ7_9ACTN|nr:hypothetical protein [Streptomyces spinoverrucosus]GEC06056.1 hypothetical protein SSP24_37110 [Streptomyces spinoverrucosus]GHB90150.1 hypothetical protein GCM10010397_72980 [Streptomyces spinoverrucosus]
MTSDHTPEHRLLSRIRELDGRVVRSPTRAAPTPLWSSPPPYSALGPDRVLAVTAVSESLAEGELPHARRLAEEFGVVHLTAWTSELTRPGYRANGPDRCYFCKSEVLDTIAALAHEHGFDDQVATGTTPTTPSTRTAPVSAQGGSAASGPRSSMPA